MTSTAIKLARECGFWEFFECSEFNDGDVQQLTRFYAKAQAQALRDAADLVQDDYGCDVDSAAKLRSMAADLEREA